MLSEFLLAPCTVMWSKVLLGFDFDMCVFVLAERDSEDRQSKEKEKEKEKDKSKRKDKDAVSSPTIYSVLFGVELNYRDLFAL